MPKLPRVGYDYVLFSLDKRASDQFVTGIVTGINEDGTLVVGDPQTGMMWDVPLSECEIVHPVYMATLESNLHDLDV